MKTVLITGASRGIGSAAAVRFASEGWNVAGTCLESRARGEMLKEKLNHMRPCCEIWPLDVSRRAAVFDTVRQVRERFGRIDALVNNAGQSSWELFQDASPEEFQRLFDVDVFGTFHCTQAVLPDMISRKKGVIVNVSSVWGLSGASCEVVYSSAKAAVIGFTKALAREVGPSGIRVNCVAPGAMDTDMMTALGQETVESLAELIPLGRLGAASEAADAIYYLASDASSYLTGQVLSPNGGLVI